MSPFTNDLWSFFQPHSLRPKLANICLVTLSTSKCCGKGHATVTRWLSWNTSRSAPVTTLDECLSSHGVCRQTPSSTSWLDVGGQSSLTSGQRHTCSATDRETRDGSISNIENWYDVDTVFCYSRTVCDRKHSSEHWSAKRDFILLQRSYRPPVKTAIDWCGTCCQNHYSTNFYWRKTVGYTIWWWWWYLFINTWQTQML